MKKSSRKIGLPNVTSTSTIIKANVTLVARQLNKLVNDYFRESAVQKIIP